jgi:hypothetical protein
VKAPTASYWGLITQRTGSRYRKRRTSAPLKRDH